MLFSANTDRRYCLPESDTTPLHAHRAAAANSAYNKLSARCPQATRFCSADASPAKGEQGAIRPDSPLHRGELKTMIAAELRPQGKRDIADLPRARIAQYPRILLFQRQRERVESRLRLNIFLQSGDDSVEHLFVILLRNYPVLPPPAEVDIDEHAVPHISDRAGHINCAGFIPHQQTGGFQRGLRPELPSAGETTMVGNEYNRPRTP